MICYFLLLENVALKTQNNSKITMKLEIVANLTVDGAQNAFYEN